MAIIDIPLKLTYGPNVSNGNVQIVSTPDYGSTLLFKGDYSEDATMVFKAGSPNTIDNDRYVRLKFLIKNTNLVRSYTAWETHNGENYETLLDPKPLSLSPLRNYIIAKASNVVEYYPEGGDGELIRYDDTDAKLVAEDQRRHSYPVASIRPLEVIPSGTFMELDEVEVREISNKTSYVYYIAYTGPDSYMVHTVYGIDVAPSNESTIPDNTITYPLPDVKFRYAFSTDVRLTSLDIAYLEHTPEIIETIWAGLVPPVPMSFTRDSMASLEISEVGAEAGYLPFSAGVQLYRGIISTANHLALKVNAATVKYPIPEYYAQRDTLIALYYDTKEETWAQLYRTGLIHGIKTIEISDDHHGFTLLNRPLTRAELNQLCGHHNLLLKVLFDGYVLKDGFRSAHIVSMYPGTEGIVGKDVLTDLVTGNKAYITNYSSDVRNLHMGLTHGIQDFYVVKDDNGIIQDTVLSSDIRFDISYLQSRFHHMFSEYTIMDITDNGDHRIRTYSGIDSLPGVPVLDYMYINGTVLTEIPEGTITPDLPTALDGAGFTVTPYRKDSCYFKVLPYYINENMAALEYARYREQCLIDTNTISSSKISCDVV
jgi:hypothetical protein